MTRGKSRPDLDTFHAHLDALKLSFIREHYPDVVRRAAEEQSDHLSVLERLIEGEANLRRDRSIERRIRLARFPVKKTLDSFDWSWPNKINRLQVQNLFRLRFLDDATNVVLVGGVGLGKSHLVTALGLQACERGHSVLFTSAIDAVNTLAAAKAAGQLKRDLRRYLRPRLLILDELGYLPIDKSRRRPAVPDHQPTIRTRLPRNHHQSRVQALARDLQPRCDPDLRRPRPPAPPCRDCHC